MLPGETAEKMYERRADNIRRIASALGVTVDEYKKRDCMSMIGLFTEMLSRPHISKNLIHDFERILTELLLFAEANGFLYAQSTRSTY
jgi:hypothetical protein